MAGEAEALSFQGLTADGRTFSTKGSRLLQRIHSMGLELELQELADRDRDEFIPTRRSLLSRLRAADDHVSWTDFFETYWRLIYSVARKSGLSEADAQDVVQETVLTVSKNIGDFRYDPDQGSFKGWLLKTTRWRIFDVARRRQRINRREAAFDESITDQQIDPASEELNRLWDAEWQRNLLDSAVRRVKNMVNPKHYQAFELNVLKGWPAGKVAEMLGMHTAGVHLAKHRVGKLIKAEVRRLEQRDIAGELPS